MTVSTGRYPYLKNAWLIEGTKRGFYKITKRGVDVLKLNPKVIDVKYLKQFPEFNDFLTRSNKDKETDSMTEKERRLLEYYPAYRALNISS